MRKFALLSKAFFVTAVAVLMVGFVQISPATAANNATALPATKHHSPHIMKLHGMNAQVAVANGSDLLQYNGGPVMKSSTTYAIFWEPSTLPDGSATHVSATYNSLLQRYFGDVGGSGLYNVNTEYYDTTGHIANNSTFGGAWVDTSAYPASDCTDTATAGNCLIDTDIQAEVQKAMTANNWSSGLTHLFFVFTAWNEGSCFDATSAACSFTQYCGYHSYFTDNASNPIVYANMPYTGTSLNGCGVPKTPNNDADADSTISVASHEQMEAVTDPMLNAWYDSQGNEIGDKCAWNFGTLGQDNGNANESWNSNLYLVQQEWSNALDGCTQGEQTTPPTPPPSGPITIVGANDGTVYAVNTTNGSVAWHYKTGGAVVSSPAVANGVVYFGSKDHYVYALNASNGSLVWRYKTSSVVYSSPIVLNNMVYIGSNDGFMYALNAINGSLVWRYQTRGPVFNTPAIANNVVYVSSGNGLLCALNASNGKLRWHAQLRRVVFSSPAVANNIVYVGASNGFVYALNASRGSVIWHVQTGRPVWLTPTIVNNVVYIGSSNGYLYALNGTKGRVLWHYRTKGSIGTQADVVNNVVYIGSYDRSVYALDATKGKLLWHFQTRGRVLSRPVLNNGVVYVGSDDRNLYALNATGGTAAWHFAANAGIEDAPVVAQLS